MKKFLSILLCIAMIFSITACSNQTSADKSAEKGKYTPGTYTATAKGYGGDVSVTIEVDAKMEIVDLLLNNSGNVIDWLMYDHGFEFSTPKRGFTETDIYDVKYQFMPNETGANKEAIGTYYDSIYKDYTELGGKNLLLFRYLHNIIKQSFSSINLSSSMIMVGNKVQEYLLKSKPPA